MTGNWTKIRYNMLQEQSISTSTKAWLKSAIIRELASGVALKTVMENGESEVDVYFPTDAQVRRVQALCEGYFETLLCTCADCHIGEIEKKAHELSLADSIDKDKVVCFRFMDDAESQEGAHFLREFGRKMIVFERDATVLEPIPTDPNWQHTPENLKRLGPGWKQYGDAEDQVQSLLDAMKRVNGKH